jgi:hypothetical protein
MVGFALSIYRGFKYGLLFYSAVLLLTAASSIPVTAQSEFTVESMSGSVTVRYGVSEEWEPVRPGTVLRPEDSIRTGKNSTVILTRGDGMRYWIPSETLLDGSDFRHINLNELLLLLAMEDMLSVPDRLEGDRPVSRTTVLHGESRNRDVAQSNTGGVEEIINQRMNGVRYLFDQNYTASAILKIRETLRLYPHGRYRVSAMMLVAGIARTVRSSRRSSEILPHRV